MRDVCTHVMRCTIKNGTQMTSPRRTLAHATIEQCDRGDDIRSARASASPVAARRLELGLPLGPSLGVLRVHL